MTVFSIVLFASVVLYLVDKNRVWRGFWIVIGCTGIAVLVSIGGFYWYQHHEAKLAAQENLTPDEFMAQQAEKKNEDKYDALAKKYGGESERDSPNTFPIFDPKGIVRDIPVAEVSNALQAGGRLAVWRQDKKSNWCLTPLQSPVMLPPGSDLEECSGPNTWRPVNEKSEV